MTESPKEETILATHSNASPQASSDSKAQFPLNKILYGLLAVALYLVLVYLLPTPSGLSPEGKKALAFMASAVLLWVTEVIPVGVSAMLLALLLPLLKIVPTSTAMQNFMIPTVIFVFSAFVIAIAFMKTGLGERLSLSVSGIFGNRSDRVVLSFMVATSAISTVLADIPTAVMMAGIAYPLLVANGCEPGKSNFGKAIMLGISVASSIGGVGTPAGSGMNVLALSLLRTNAKMEVSFLQWSAIGIPVAIVLTFIAWWILVKVYPSEFETVKGLDDLKSRRAALGALTSKEKMFAAIFSVTLLLWFTQTWNKLDLPTVAVLTAAAFFLPGINLLSWDDVKGKIGWDVLLLIGSANALAYTLTVTKGSIWLANSLLGGMTSVGVVVLLGAVIGFGIIFHMIVPVGSAFLAVTIPVLAVMATKMGISPALLVVPMGFTASCVFLMPLDPNMLTTYNYKYWSFWDAMKPGLWISIAWLVVLTVAMYIAQAVGII